MADLKNVLLLEKVLAGETVVIASPTEESAKRQFDALKQTLTTYAQLGLLSNG